LLGATASTLTLFIIPNPLFRPSRFHGISLLASPLLTGLGVRQARLSLRTGARTVFKIESFRNGFAFALRSAQSFLQLPALNFTGKVSSTCSSLSFRTTQYWPQRNATSCPRRCLLGSSNKQPYEDVLKRNRFLAVLSLRCGVGTTTTWEDP
jgi:hypothetical protein